MRASRTPCLLILSFLLIGLFTANVRAGDTSTTTQKWLFVQEGASGTLAGPDNQHLTLTMKKVRDFTSAFTDRPIRDALDIPNQKFFDNWDTAFADDPPNAALSYRLPGESRPRTIILKLTSPTYDQNKRTSTYKAALVHEARRTLDPNGPATTVLPPLGKFLSPSLFIDDAPGPDPCPPPPQDPPPDGCYVQCIANWLPDGTKTYVWAPFCIGSNG